MPTYIFALIEDEDEGFVEQTFEDHDAAMAFARSQLVEHGDPEAVGQISIAVQTSATGVEWLGAYAFGEDGALIWEPFELDASQEPSGLLN